MTFSGFPLDFSPGPAYNGDTEGGISPVLLIGKEVFLMLNTIGFLGCGNMGGAIARAVCKAADPQNVWLANLSLIHI